MINLKMTFVSCVVLFSSALFAQHAEEQRKVKYLFPEGDIRWIRHYESSGLSMPGTTISLGWDGSYCRGQLTHLYSGDVFTLKGYLKRDSLFLNEFDSRGQHTAELSGTLSTQHISLRWRSLHNALPPIQLYFDAAAEDEGQVSNCRDHHRIKTAEGKVGSRIATLLIQQAENSRLKGVLNFSAPNEHFTLSGRIENNFYRFIAENSDGTRSGELVLRPDEHNHLTGDWIPNKGSKEAVNCQFTDEFKLFCIEYSDYSGYYQLVLPLGEAGSPFNKWSRDLFAEYFNGVQQQLKTFKSATPVNRPETRAVNRTVLWCEILYSSADLMSGLLHYTSETEAKSYEKPFVFDLSAGKALMLEDVVKNRQKLKMQCKKWMEKQQTSQGKNLEKWIENESFDQFSLCSDGLLFYTKGATTSLPNTVFLPFNQIGSNLREGTSVGQLLD